MENTSYISEISYKIENWLHQGYSIEKIKKFIVAEQNANPPTFPKNLKLVDAYYDSFYGSSGCAFIDSNTGETIIGFAGTNQSNGWIQTGNDFITDGVGLGLSGIAPNSSYMKKANDFINNLKDNGYNITQATGHSLGGALCTIAGLNHDIPLIVTYNGAPLYALSTAELTGVASKLRKLYAQYNGKIVRFVSNEDWLNGISDSVDALYYGDEYMIYNGRGHDIKYFNGSKEQSFITKVLQMTKNGSVTLTVDFDQDNKIDIRLTQKDLYIKNLLGIDGLYSGNGTDMKIDPQAFYNLEKNLTSSMAGDDFNWIKDVVVKCDEKNESIKSNLHTREDVLAQKVVEGLHQAHLSEVLSGINDSHGVLLSNIQTIRSLAIFDTYNVTRKFDRWGNSGNRRWFLDGVEFEEYDLIDWIKDLKRAASTLHYQVTTTGEFPVYDEYGAVYTTYKFDTISDIGKAYVAITNTFLSKTKKAFKGTGLRSGKNDGLVNAISEVMDFELQNVEELKKKVENLARMAGVLADNFFQADEWIQGKIKSGEAIGSFTSAAIPKNYKAYLKENHIFDDVKDVLEAYDLQVEDATTKLSESIVSDFMDVIDKSYRKLNSLYTDLETFIKAVNYIYSKLNKNLTSIRYEYEVILSGTRKKEVKEHHGKLSDSFASDIVTEITNAKHYVNPTLPNFTTTVTFIGAFNSQINYIKDYFNTIIEQAVYNSMELDTIINAQMMVSLRIQRMIEEIKQIDNAIDVQSKGKSLKSYQDSLGDFVKLLKYFDNMINDCFGANK